MTVALEQDPRLARGDYAGLVWDFAGGMSPEAADPELALTVGIACYHLNLRDRSFDWLARWAGSHPFVDAGPLVTIVVPTHNRRRLLRRALRSIVDQRYRPLEILVVNDAGEPVGDLVDALEAEPGVRSRTIDLPENRYLAAARNAGLSQASGDYVAFLDDDDRLYPHHVGHLVALARDGGYRAVCGTSFFEDGGLTAGPPPDFEWEELLVRNVTPVQGMLIERELARRVGPFDTGLRANEDWEYWIRLRRETEILTSLVPSSVVRAQRGAGRMTSAGLAPFLEAHRVIYRRYLDLAPASRLETVRKLQEETLADIEARMKTAATPAERAKVRVVTYHRVAPDPAEDPFGLCVSPETFESHLEHYLEHYDVVGPEGLEEPAAEGDRPRLLLTIDDGYRDVYYHAYPLLQKHGVPAVLFVTTGASGDRPYWWEVLTRSSAFRDADAPGRERLQREWRFLAPDVRREKVERELDALPPEVREAFREQVCTRAMLEEMHASGLVHLGAHTREHSSLGKLSWDDLVREVGGSIDDLEALTGTRPTLFAFPHGAAEDQSPMARQYLKQSGIRYAFTTEGAPESSVAWPAAGTADALAIPREVVTVEQPALEQPAVEVRPRELVVLSGIGGDNLGDDAMLIATVRDLRQADPDARVVVLAEAPEQCRPVAEQIGVPILRSLQQLVQHYLSILEPGESRPLAILQLAADLIQSRETLLGGEALPGVPAPFLPGLRALMSADAVVDCGGANLCPHWKTYFYEKCLDYLVCARPLLVSGQGVDRFEDHEDRQLLRTALNEASEITTREPRSEDYLRAIGVSAPLATVGDDALTLEPAAPSRVQEILRQAGLDPDEEFVALQYRHYLDYERPECYTKMAAFVEAVADATGCRVVGVPMHFSGTDERGHLRRLSELVGRRDRYAFLDCRLTPGEAKGIFAAARVAFGISYHSAVFSLGSGTPFLGLYRGEHYTQKMHGLAELYGRPELPVDFDATAPEELARRVAALAKRREEIRRRLLEDTRSRAESVRASRRRLLERLPAAPTVTTAPARIFEGEPTPVPWHDLRRTEPISRNWGFDRGRPVDRFYIEGFLEREQAAIRGTACELLNDDYVRRFGGERVRKCEVLDLDPSNPRATWIDDLTAPRDAHEGKFDCFLLTQTLPYIYEAGAALASAYRALKEGGVLLVTVPSIIKYHREPEDHWRFTPDSLARMVRERCPGARATIEPHGNLLAAVAFLHGMAVEDLDPAELAHRDPEYPLVVTARIERRGLSS